MCMDELHRLADKFEQEVDLMFQILEGLGEKPDERALELAVSQSKRVRRDSNLLVRALARYRDSYSREA